MLSFCNEDNKKAMTIRSVHKSDLRAIANQVVHCLCRILNMIKTFQAYRNKLRPLKLNSRSLDLSRWHIFVALYSPLCLLFNCYNTDVRGAAFCDPLDGVVYARHGRELMGWKSPVREPGGVHDYGY